MPYCPKCGNQVDETTAFCPRCGTSLKGAATPESVSFAQTNLNNKMEKTENHGTPENAKKGEKGEKNEFGFIGYLMGGFILVSIGIFTLLDLTNPKTSNQDLAGMLVTIGAIIIVGGVYMAITLRKRLSSATAT